MHASTGSITPTTYLTILPRSLEQIQLPRRQSTTRKAVRSHKLRIVTSPVAPAFRPSPRTKKTIRPKQEQPPSPAMSGYSVSSCPSLSTPTSYTQQYSSSDQSTYGYTAPYQAGAPQYTQSQINTYYAQYQCYPPQPYQVIPDYYVQPVVPQTGYQQSVTAGYETGHWQTQSDHLDLPTSHDPTRSNSRTRYFSRPPYHSFFPNSQTEHGHATSPPALPPQTSHA
jgi:hypothetical protein